MAANETPIRQLLETLQERAKELDCLYRVDEALSDPGRDLADVCRLVVEALPAGWKHPEVCCAKLTLRETVCQTRNYRETPWSMESRVAVDGVAVGRLQVGYTEARPLADEGPFLKEERKLLDTIGERLALFVTRRDLRKAHEILEQARRFSEERNRAEWVVVLDFLRRTDPDLLRNITRRMINHLALIGVPEAETLLRRSVEDDGGVHDRAGDNVPIRKAELRDLVPFSKEAFRIAARNLGEDEMVGCIRRWIDEERSSFLIEVLEDQNRALSEVLEAIEQHRTRIGDTAHFSEPARRTISTALLRRLFTDEIDYINVAKDFVGLEDVYELAGRIVYPFQGHGKLGGKSAGLFLAERVLHRGAQSHEVLRGIRVPRTWYVSSDALLEFLNYNNLRDLYFRKYMDLEQTRQEYPRIVHVLKNSAFPPDIARGIALALDDLGDRPLIVRSSSLLEDRMGSSFAGKYKSLFLANRGTRQERLAALLDAIAEVYASTFSPDPIQYRAERGLLDVHEEMGIMIQEVVGQAVGKYFLPAFSGVAMRKNEFRWSARIRREDGLARMVPGLGTRAVDRVGDDYPVLVAPAQPGLRVNASPDEIVRYSPRWVDVLNLETNSFETVKIRDLLREHGEDYPAIRRVVSIVDEQRVRKPVGLEPDFARDAVAVTFEGLIADTAFIAQIETMLAVLSETLGKPVDIEFASDGEHLYLLQSRAQSHGEAYAPAPIPRNLPRDVVLFEASRNISNGRVPELTHVVYVDPERYAELEDLRDLRDVGRAVSRLNKLLPRRQFALMGPGRWGSRGDIRLGVSVTYADISNAAVLMEIARKKGSYVPELSFGTHFFQDLVEAEIRYIPLYLDEPGNTLNETFLRRAGNVLPDLLPEFARLADVLHVVEIPRERDGRILRILLNADLDEGVGIFDISRASSADRPHGGDVLADLAGEDHWRWRMRMAERVAADLDASRFGVKALYLFGSVKNATAGPGSDIDLIVHDHGEGPRRNELALWLEGWSRSLAEMNYLRTGYRTRGLLDVHFVTDRDLELQTSFAAKIGAVTDPARRLVLASDRGTET